jgi:1-acyl-sn-glycerol-3-phosphate acyltransferase
MTDSKPGAIRHVTGIIFGVYVWLVFAACVFAAIIFALLLPGLDRRRRWVTVCAGLPFRLAGMKTTVRGLGKLPSGHCVLVANHASYLDGVLLQGFMPPRFSYVIKGEMGKVPVVSFLLRRIGSKFVERFDTSGSARDARQLLKAASAGESLAFFPEGTFVAEPGVGKFRAGAFAAAIRASVPVVPLVISGSRKILPADAFLPRYGHLQIDVLDPIEPSDPDYSDSRTLAETARQRILEILDEPDLLAKPGK